MIDFDEYEAAGIANAHDHEPLIEYLVGLGFTVDDMVEADREGRLYALAGDALIRPGRSTLSMRAAADALQLPLERVERTWAALGLTVAGPDEPTLSDADLRAIATCATTASIAGDDAAFALLRVIGASLARIAEAQVSTTRLALPEMWLENSGDELATARSFRSLAEIFPDTVAMIDVVYRRHVSSARMHLEAVQDESSMTVACGVGFADLSGFTSLTQTLTTADLFSLVSDFTATVADIVHAGGGRVVKFIGDAVMWVSSSPRVSVQIAADLANHETFNEEVTQVRAGLAFGTVVNMNGDYFGHAVNLAARLVDAAMPGQILASTPVRDAVQDWPAVACEPFRLKGFPEPVPAFLLQH